MTVYYIITLILLVKFMQNTVKSIKICIFFNSRWLEEMGFDDWSDMKYLKIIFLRCFHYQYNHIQINYRNFKHRMFLWTYIVNMDMYWLILVTNWCSRLNTCHETRFVSLHGLFVYAFCPCCDICVCFVSIDPYVEIGATQCVSCQS